MICIMRAHTCAYLVWLESLPCPLVYYKPFTPSYVDRFPSNSDKQIKITTFNDFFCILYNKERIKYASLQCCIQREGEMKRKNIKRVRKRGKEKKK